MNILDTIIAHKRVEVQKRKEHASNKNIVLEKQPYFERPTISLREFLIDPARTGIIAEFKRKSPSKGDINDKATVKEVTEAYAQFASGISILTDEEFFGGTMDDLQSARHNNIPILRKDFMIDEFQIVEAKAIGADVILLIAACLSVQEVQQLAKLAKSLGLEVLLEVHNEEELGHVCEAVDFVGVNNRNLKTFEVNIETSLKLFDKIPAEKLAIAESGISETDSIVTLRKAGFKGFLIGENFMKEADPAIAFARFVTALNSKLV
jgi:indole-3-glycerol phosphate synthase